ncbi:MAG: hypothetical protein EOO71_28185 [Myxococcaceae bacterium]|nr:MAG: hypothetical protein EOO71_28185 [Myxococcaceae bacterium]
MVGLVIASHGRLADELVSTAEQIVGKLPAVATCSIEPGAPVEDLRVRPASRGPAAAANLTDPRGSAIRDCRDHPGPRRQPPHPWSGRRGLAPPPQGVPRGGGG